MKEMDLSDKGSGSEGVISGTATEAATPERISSEIQVKTCVDCGATKTPLWRGGPAGPKSLCNACGIRGSKKKRALLGLKKEDKKMKKSSGNKNPISANCTSSSGGSTTTSSTNVDKKKKKKKKKPSSKPDSASVHWTKLGEVEQAAYLLMSLSCGSVYA